MTAGLRAVVDAATRRLAAAGVETPRLDARVLVGHILDCDPSAVAYVDRPAPDAAARRRLALALRRRLAGEPVARIVGRREFWSLDFAVGPATLVPRPDSETLVEAALAASRRSARRILDLGTGTGCLVLSLLTEIPDATGLGMDCAAGAVRVARRNARALGIAERVRFAIGDWAMGVSDRFDLVVSNPPYIPTGELDALPAEVRRDPRAALDGGPDGLDAYRAIAAALPGLLEPNGLTALEVGVGQAADVAALLAAAGLTVRGTAADLAGRARVVIASA